ncbi:hypothetical protein C8N36_1046 [Pelagimonas varians]|uniref:Uncharacterized protein n=1 Tax=Pelagimonas varians TaxID=696760 RepID=A0A238K911_9RHOB|nr:hypothetical protein C8N36_1046 [Pelagimonas varians]SMX38977.1 hypothetical protein PEV8663_01638 [Pelagimonas varians]
MKMDFGVLYPNATKIVVFYSGPVNTLRIKRCSGEACRDSVMGSGWQNDDEAAQTMCLDGLMVIRWMRSGRIDADLTMGEP